MFYCINTQKHVVYGLGHTHYGTLNILLHSIVNKFENNNGDPVTKSLIYKIKRATKCTYRVTIDSNIFCYAYLYH